MPFSFKRAVCRQLTAGFLILILFFTAFPGNIPVMAATAKTALTLSQGQFAVAAIQVSKGQPPSASPSSKFTLSANPTTDDIRQTRLFEEPLFPLGGQASDSDNQVLAVALAGYASTRDESVLESYVAANPQSPWLASVLTNLGLLEFNNGYFSTAMADWQQAWSLGKSETDWIGKLVVDRAIAELIKMNCRVGRAKEAEDLLKQVENRPLHGIAGNMMGDSIQATRMMDYQPNDCFKCGPYALESILEYEKAMTPNSELALAAYRTTQQGTSLSDLVAFSSQLGMKMQAAKRVSGSDLPLPSVVHWKLNHFGALLKKQGNRYLLQDPTFGQNALVLADAVDQESDGYFLIPAGSLPSGWVSVSDDEAKQVFGRGNTTARDKGKNKKDDKKDCPSPGGGTPPMALWSFHFMMANLNVEDSPVGYTPPLGPAVKLRVNYNHLETNQPSVIKYSNFGPLWNFNWISTLTGAGSVTAQLNLGTGGFETYANFSTSNSTYAPERDSGAVLFKNPSTNQWERDDKDGSKMIFGLSDGTRLYLTQQIDPAGNPLTFSYDASSYRLMGIYDALNQVNSTSNRPTTITYGSDNPSDPSFYLVTKVTDIFGRSASFRYTNVNGQMMLQQITDAAGNVSTFTYGGYYNGTLQKTVTSTGISTSFTNLQAITNSSNDFITSVTTPYGQTSFTYIMSRDGNTASLQAQEPNGAQKRVDAVNDATVNYGTPVAIASLPTNLFPSKGYFANVYLYYRNSFFWDRKAMQQAAGDYSSAHILHFFHDGNNCSEVLEAEKMALENWTFYAYQNQTDQLSVTDGMLENVTQQARVLDNGVTQMTSKTYNTYGNTLSLTDPVGRLTAYNYYSNGVDLKTVSQKNFSGGYDQLAYFTYNSQHEPLTYQDQAGETTRYSYFRNGQLNTVTNAKGETTTFNFVNGYPTSVQGPDNSPLSLTSLVYDKAGHPGTVTNGEGYQLNYGYDNLDRKVTTTYPDGSYEQETYNPSQSPLDITQHRDRQGRLTTYVYNGLRQITSVTDANNHTTYYGWCSCGALKSITDANNHTTNWDQDIEGRVTTKSYADNTQEITLYEQNTSRVKSVTDGRKQSKNYQYNTDDTLASISYANAQNVTPSVNFSYDPAYNRITQMNDGAGTTAYKYIPPVASGTALGAGQLFQVSGPWANSTVTYSYDPLGRILTRSINGVEQANSYDVLGRVYNIANSLGSFTSTFENDSSRVNTMSMPNGQQVKISYLGNGAATFGGERRLQQIQNLQSVGGPALLIFGYSFNPVGTISNWTQAIGASPAQSYQIGYDNADQVTSAAAPGTATYRYGYDPAGNRQTETINSQTTTATYNPANELTQLTPAKSGDKAYQWDAENRLVGISYPGTTKQTQLKYDGHNRCVQIAELSNGQVQSTKRFLWCGNERCEERDSFDNVTKRFFAQGEQMYGQNYYYLQDHLGSVREITDATGKVRASYSYDLWGRRTKILGDLDSDYGYANYYTHVLSGFSLTLNRAYDSATGRWLSRDPLRESQGVNLFRYADNNPISNIDPTGLWTVTITGGGYIGGSVSFGYNEGHFSITVYGGQASGASITYNPNDESPNKVEGCPATTGDFSVGFKRSAEVGAGTFASGEFEVEGGARFSPATGHDEVYGDASASAQAGLTNFLTIGGAAETSAGITSETDGDGTRHYDGFFVPPHFVQPSATFGASEFSFGVGAGVSY